MLGEGERGGEQRNESVATVRMNEAPVVGTRQWASTCGTRPSQIATAMTSSAAPAQFQPSRVSRVPSTALPAIDVHAAG
jgi:hypothetical protein